MLTLTSRIALMMLCLVVTTAWSGPTLAQSCTFSFTDLSFGAVAGTQVDTTGTFVATCTGNALSTVKVCPHLGDGSGGTSTATPRYLSNGAATVGWQLYSNSARTTVWGSTGYAFNPPRVLVNLGLGGTGSTSTTMYARYFSGQGGAAAGTYLSSLTGGHVAVRFKYNDLSASCDTSGTLASPQPGFTVRADRAIACTVSANDVDFGSVAGLTTAVNGQGSLGVNCTRNTPYTVSLGDGLTGTGPTSRLMTLGANSITYGLYRDAARSLPWGDGTGETLGGTGTGSSQTLQVYGRVPVQTTPSPGTYTDTVVTTVTY